MKLSRVKVSRMSKQELRRVTALAYALKIRLEPLILPGFQLHASENTLDVIYQGANERQIQLELWNDAETDRKNIDLIVSSVLSNLQDAIVDTTQEHWPKSQNPAELPLPDSSWN